MPEESQNGVSSWSDLLRKIGKPDPETYVDTGAVLAAKAAMVLLQRREDSLHELHS